jgi:hypothetical protein
MASFVAFYRLQRTAMYPHQIRLAQPWERLTVEGTPPSLRRRFGRPRQLDDWERVWLIPMNGIPGTGLWRLNGEILNWSRRGDELSRAQITAILRDRNELIVEWPNNAFFEGAILEIGCRAFIQNVRAQPIRQGDHLTLSAAIDLVSECIDDPLELYALLNGETEGYFGPFSTNRPLIHEFQLSARTFSPGEPVTLRIDLICRSTIWDSLELTVQGLGD